MKAAATWEHVGTLRPDPDNPVIHTDEEVAELRALIAETVWTEPIVCRVSDRQIIAGHRRLAAALLALKGNAAWQLSDAPKPGLVPVRFVDVDEKTARRLNLASNALAKQSAWDEEVLSRVLREMDPSEIVGIGFDEDELRRMLEAGDQAKPKSDPDEAPEPKPGPPDSQPGQVYELGPHRLVCGDSTKPEAWAALMGGERASMVFTSPPYGQQRDYGDAAEHVQDWLGLMCGVFANPAAHVVDDAQVFVNLGLVHQEARVVRYWDPWISKMEADGWRLFGWYVWDQGWGLPMTGERGRLMPSHEFVFHLNKEKRTVNQTVPKQDENVGHREKSGLRRADGTVTGWASPEASKSTHKAPDSVIRVNREMGGSRQDHPAVFPVAFPLHLIEAYSSRGDLVLEPFAGSGTTLIACAETGRVARCIELDPRYCDVIRRRWTIYADANNIPAGEGALR